MMLREFTAVDADGREFQVVINPQQVVCAWTNGPHTSVSLTGGAHYRLKLFLRDFMRECNGYYDE